MHPPLPIKAMHIDHPAGIALALLLALALMVLSGAIGVMFGRRRLTQEQAELRAALEREHEEARRVADRQMSTLRHDLRGMLSPAMLIADRLVEHQDPAVKRGGEVVMRTVERMAGRLAESRVTEGRATGSGTGDVRMMQAGPHDAAPGQAPGAQ